MKEAGWWLVLGDAGTQELHAIKRLSFSDRATARLSFTADAATSAAAFSNLNIYLVRLSSAGLRPIIQRAHYGSSLPLTRVCCSLVIGKVLP